MLMMVLSEHQNYAEPTNMSETGNPYSVFSPSSRESLGQSGSWCKNALDAHWHKHVSNNFLRTVPYKKSFPYSTLEEMKDCSVHLTGSFKMPYHIDEQAADIFIRGRKLMLANIPGLKVMLDRLNNGERLRVPEIIDLFNNVMEQEAILFLLQKIYEYGGIKISQPVLEPSVNH